MSQTGNSSRSKSGINTTAVQADATSAQIYLLCGMLVSIFLPIIFNLGSIALPAPRLFVLLFVIPAGLRWGKGLSGPKRALDYVVIVFSIWIMLSIFVNNGASSLQTSGSIALEMIGAYFVGRWCVRNKNSFFRMVRFQFYGLVILLPFALLEAATGEPIIMRTLSSVFQTWPIISYEPRLGLERVQAVFQHPILYGYFAAVTLSLLIYGINLHSSKMKRVVRVFVVVMSTFLSLSSGPFSGLMMQAILAFWEKITRGFKGRWKVVIFTVIAVYVLIDVLSNRTPFHVIVSYLTFNTGSAYNRILIFHYGWQNVVANPIFGIGLNDWARPHWMLPSVDNFFLLYAMRNGIPGFALLLGAFLYTIIKLGRMTYNDPDLAMIRTGINLSLVGTMIIGATVFLWGPVYVWLWFFFGASMWLLEDEPAVEDKTAVEGSSNDDATQISRYSRFAPKPAVRSRPVQASAQVGRKSRNEAARNDRPAQKDRIQRPLQRGSQR
jgi:hypothetical protein